MKGNKKRRKNREAKKMKRKTRRKSANSVEKAVMIKVEKVEVVAGRIASLKPSLL